MQASLLASRGAMRSHLQGAVSYVRVGRNRRTDATASRAVGADGGSENGNPKAALPSLPCNVFGNLIHCDV